MLEQVESKEGESDLLRNSLLVLLFLNFWAINISYANEVKPKLENEKKSEWVAVGLSSFIGLGIGHIYVDEKLTWRSTAFAGTDLLGYALIANYESGRDCGNHPCNEDLFIVLIFAALRGIQIVDSWNWANLHNAKIDPEPILSIQTTTNDFRISIPLVSFKF